MLRAYCEHLPIMVWHHWPALHISDCFDIIELHVQLTFAWPSVQAGILWAIIFACAVPANIEMANKPIANVFNMVFLPVSTLSVKYPSRTRNCRSETVVFNFCPRRMPAPRSGLAGLSRMDLDGALLSWPRFEQGMIEFRDVTLPLVNQAGLRDAVG